MFLKTHYRVNCINLFISVVLLSFLTYDTWSGLIRPIESASNSARPPQNTSVILFINSPQIVSVNIYILKSFRSEFNLFNYHFIELVKTRLLVQNISQFKKFEINLAIYRPPGHLHFFTKKDTDEYLILS